MKRILVGCWLLACFAAHAAEGSEPTAQQARMKACNAHASSKALKGDERKVFMKDCLSNKPEMTAQQGKMKTCNAEASAQALKGDARKAFMKNCLSNK